MKPIEEQKTITVYRCADCNSEHGTKVNAENCCACYECDGPTTPEMRKERSEPGGYDVGRYCSWCRLRLWIKRQQDRVRLASTHVENAKRKVIACEQELASEQKVLDGLLVRREALPPKPRQKKENAA